MKRSMSAAVAKYNVTPVDTKWVDNDKAFEEGSMQNPFTHCCQREQKWKQARLVCGNSSAGSF